MRPRYRMKTLLSYSGTQTHPVPTQSKGPWSQSSSWLGAMVPGPDPVPAVGRDYGAQSSRYALGPAAGPGPTGCHVCLGLAG